MRKPVFEVSNQPRHKPGYAATEDSKSLETSDLTSRKTGLCSENKDTDKVHIYLAFDWRLCFRICKKRFPRDVALLQLLKLSIFLFLFVLMFLHVYVTNCTFEAIDGLC